ncbi:putative uncharacterized protein DDB_G0268364 [Alosa alosa]|nr:putative uncharacterized protein DDB_G0268364 [Alosa alosa]
MARAPIQLFELNQRTLSQWFMKTQREKVRTVLAPGPGAAAEGRPQPPQPPPPRQPPQPQPTPPPPRQAAAAYWYLMVTEYLECRRCQRKVAGWSQEVVRQLEPGRQSQFPALLTYMLSCDQRVISMLRERTRGEQRHAAVQEWMDSTKKVMYAVCRHRDLALQQRGDHNHHNHHHHDNHHNHNQHHHHHSHHHDKLQQRAQQQQQRRQQWWWQQRQAQRRRWIVPQLRWWCTDSSGHGRQQWWRLTRPGQRHHQRVMVLLNVPPLPILPQTLAAAQLLPPLAAAHPATAGPATAPPPYVPYSTVYYRWKKGSRAKTPHVCGQCGQPRRKETGHSGYKSDTFCVAAAGRLREMREKDKS